MSSFRVCDRCGKVLGEADPCSDPPQLDDYGLRLHCVTVGQGGPVPPKKKLPTELDLCTDCYEALVTFTAKQSKSPLSFPPGKRSSD